MSHPKQPKPRCECHECTQLRSAGQLGGPGPPLRCIPTVTRWFSAPLGTEDTNALRTQLAALQVRERTLEEKLRVAVRELVTARDYFASCGGEESDPEVLFVRSINRALKAIGEGE